MTAERRTYTMYPQKTYAGSVQTEVLEDGRIKYYIHLLGWDQPNELIVDPCDEEEMRGVRQLHLIMKKVEGASDDEPNYVIDGDNIDEIIATLEKSGQKSNG